MSAGPAAFPLAIGGEVVQPGMSLRDYFAAQVVPALIRDWRVNKDLYDSDAELAEHAYLIAEAMVDYRKNNL